MKKTKKEAEKIETTDSKKPNNQKRPVPLAVMLPEEPSQKRTPTGKFAQSVRPRSAPPQPQATSYFSPPIMKRPRLASPPPSFYARPRSASPPSFCGIPHTPRSSRSRPGSLSPIPTISSTPSPQPLRETRSSLNLLPTSGAASLFGEECVLCGHIRVRNTSEVAQKIGNQKGKSGVTNFRADLRNSIKPNYVQVYNQLCPVEDLFAKEVKVAEKVLTTQIKND